MTSRFFRIASMAVLTIVVVPRSVTAQGGLPITITLNVPVQVQDIGPDIAGIRVHCSVKPVGGTATISFDHHDFGDAGPVVNGSVSGTAKVVLTGASPQPIAPGQQWNYQCHSDFLSSHIGPSGNIVYAPGVSSNAPLAPTSGPNLVQGTFTTQ
jgi:hypothetical protein